MNNSYDDYQYKLKSLLENGNKNHKKEILKCKSLHEVNVYCKANRLTGQQLGPLTETWLIANCQMTKNNASDCIGDCKDKYMEDNEIKASSGGKDHNIFNYVQLRVNHKIENYILTAYYLSHDNLNQLGELFIFKVKKEEIIPLIFKHGGYAHGTKSKNGPITLEDLKDESNSKEYDLRPKYGSALWKELLKYRVNESDL
jgi:hypothetical protein